MENANDVLFCGWKDLWHEESWKVRAEIRYDVVCIA